MKNYWLAIVDDDEVCLKNIRGLLVGENIKLTSLRSGEELLKFLERNVPDIILLDVVMPGMDGFETFERVRKYESFMERDPVPVVFLTGETGREMEHKGLKLGASDFIRKPVDREILLSRIDNILSNRNRIVSLEEETITDPLTGFFNKAGAEAKLPRLCRIGRGMLVILDLDNFKAVNDVYGHDMGDKVLKVFADIVRRNARPDDIPFRIGGDEFLLFLSNTTEERAVSAISGRLNKQLLEECQKLMGDNFGISIGVSAGCVTVPDKGADYQELFKLADRALYQVKQNGKHGYQLYRTGIGEDAVKGNLQEELQKMITLCGERRGSDTAMWVGQDAFVWIYRYIEHNANRKKKSITIAVFSLLSIDGSAESITEEAIADFGSLLQKTIRKNDVMTQPHANTFCLIMPESEAGIDGIIERLMEEWKKTKHFENIKVDYVAESKKYGESSAR